jgi:hypothetical protein
MQLQADGIGGDRSLEGDGSQWRPRAAIEAPAGRPPNGLGWRHAQLMAWLDENCGFGCLVGYLHNE